MIVDYSKVILATSRSMQRRGRNGDGTKFTYRRRAPLFDWAAWLAQLGERRSAEREVVGSNPGRTNTQGLLITEKKVLPL